ncbi:tyrosine-type recombinase/integrase [Actinospica sp. MGRD01-02]|uniref:Tyrosine-type recombinase/integrase n=1 Tax=Actinospica acidithermotolerans TaxID=2828514 RepID=A0A941EAF9_9ACTN|nr:tyrosine-type recombinase/integrase [Actinospica acidithermotolerans]MBR7827941.1 tyrosine-type recombinase/integrase [Actinospica acidithermotolerans]
MAYVERCGRVWRGRWLLADGHRYGSRSGFATRREAKRFADAREVGERALAEALVEERETAVEPLVTVGAWWERWFPVQDLAPSTLETYAQQYRHHIAPRFGEVPVELVTGLDLAGFSRDLRRGGLSPSSVTVTMSVLRDLLGDAAAEGVIPAAPKMPGRGRSRRAPVSVRPGRVLDLETVLRVCARLPGQFALMVVVGAFTGMRWGEVCAMRCVFLHLPQTGDAPSGAGSAWYEVHARVGAVHEDVHARRYFGPPKGGRGRVVDLPPFLAGLLARHVQAAGGRELLFVNRCEGPIRHTDWLHTWHAACEGDGSRAGGEGGALCPGARFHDLRHSHATMLAELGVPEALRDERLGHHQPGARSIYTHTTPAMRTAMIAQLEARWTQAVARSGIDVERLFADDGRARIAEHGRAGSGSSHARCGRGVAAGS